MATAAQTLGAPRLSAHAARWRRDHVFFITLPVVMAAAVFVGFAPTYYLKGMYGTPPLTPLFHVHAALFTGWVLLLIAQPVLVALRRTDVHRRIGIAGVALAIAMMGRRL